MLPPSPPGPSTWRDLPVGTRVVVRRRLSGPEAAGGHLWTDVIGVVLAVDDTGLRLRRDAPRGDETTPESAPELTVPGEQIEAAKRIPPRPAIRRPRAR